MLNTRGEMTDFYSQDKQVHYIILQNSRYCLLFYVEYGESYRFNARFVYGLFTDEMEGDDDLLTAFNYDEIFGTVLNRFILEAVAGIY